MTHFAYTQQVPSSFNPSTLADAPFKDEQALAQTELYKHLEFQSEAVAPTKNLLTSRDRRIIAEIIQAQLETIRTIWIEGGITVWVQFLDGGRLAFDRDWFATRVASVKTTLPETPLERNKRLHEELSIVCNKFGIQTGQIDWLLFSTKLYRDGQCIGLVGCNAQGLWYARRAQLGCNQFAHTAEIAVASLGVRVAVAA
ncbi:hypothetical protein [Nostoc sp. MG11]|uniref:hypothetical protein n=1 Tax=Nostoc sp. MG11 TaxID=2721166 RepID=UPI0018663D89|nr:hypothetical protein [Nostoc sp. MG11]